MTAQRILVTPRSVTRHGHPALARLAEAGYQTALCTPGQQPDEQELLRLLINAARGELLDDDAVLEALDSGRLAGATLDAYRQEPPPPDDLLLRRGHVTAVPHIGAFTQESVARAIEAAVDNLVVALGQGYPAGAAARSGSTATPQ